MSHYFSVSLGVTIAAYSIFYIHFVFNKDDLKIVGEEAILLRCLFSLKSFYLLNLIIGFIISVLFFIDFFNINESKHEIAKNIMFFFTLIPLLSIIFVLCIINDFEYKIDKIGYSFFVILYPILLISVLLYLNPIILENKIIFSIYVALFILTTYQVVNLKDTLANIKNTIANARQG